jgi:hypothetical protein
LAVKAIIPSLPQAPREPRSAGVDAAFPLDEQIEGLRIQLVGRCVPHHPRPFTSAPFVGLRRVGGAPNDGGEWVFPILDRCKRSAISVCWPLPFNLNESTD